MPTVLGELRCGHTTSVSSGNGWVGVSCFAKCPAIVPCATVDEESGSSLKTWIPCGSTLVLLGTRELILEIFSFK